MPIDMWGAFVPLDPSACRYCGIGERIHGQRWWGRRDGIGWHTWVEPTKAQRYERIRTNAADRRKAEG